MHSRRVRATKETSLVSLIFYENLPTGSPLDIFFPRQMGKHYPCGFRIPAVIDSITKKKTTPDWLLA